MSQSPAAPAEPNASTSSVLNGWDAVLEVPQTVLNAALMTSWLEGGDPLTSKGFPCSIGHQNDPNRLIECVPGPWLMQVDASAGKVRLKAFTPAPVKVKWSEWRPPSPRKSFEKVSSDPLSALEVELPLHEVTGVLTQENPGAPRRVCLTISNAGDAKATLKDASGRTVALVSVGEVTAKGASMEQLRSSLVLNVLDTLVPASLQLGEFRLQSRAPSNADDPWLIQVLMRTVGGGGGLMRPLPLRQSPAGVSLEIAPERFSTAFASFRPFDHDYQVAADGRIIPRPGRKSIGDVTDQKAAEHFTASLALEMGHLRMTFNPHWLEVNLADEQTTQIRKWTSIKESHQRDEAGAPRQSSGQNDLFNIQWRPTVRTRWNYGISDSRVNFDLATDFTTVGTDGMHAVLRGKASEKLLNLFSTMPLPVSFHDLCGALPAGAIISGSPAMTFGQTVRIEGKPRNTWYCPTPWLHVSRGQEAVVIEAFLEDGQPVPPDCEWSIEDNEDNHKGTFTGNNYTPPATPGPAILVAAKITDGLDNEAWAVVLVAGGPDQ